MCSALDWRQFFAEAAHLPEHGWQGVHVFGLPNIRCIGHSSPKDSGGWQGRVSVK